MWATKSGYYTETLEGIGRATRWSSGRPTTRPRVTSRAPATTLHVVERLTRVGPGTLSYEVTLSDPTTWTKPWTVEIPLKRSEDLVFEYACHEGNIGMEGMLSGHRAEERAGE